MAVRSLLTLLLAGAFVPIVAPAADLAQALPDEPIRVAVLDSGIRPLHPEFAAGQVVAWQDFVGNQPAPYDDHGHGTAVASRVAGATLGAYPGAELIIGKVLNKFNSLPSWVTLGTAIRWAVDEGADVISVSIWGTAPQPTNSLSIGLSIDYATQRGVLVVWIAGNGGNDPTVLGQQVPSTPSTVLVGASSPQVIVVGAARADGTRAAFSQKDPEVLAHGDGVTVACGDAYVCEGAWGTSFAAPWVAGAAARLLADGAPRDPDWLTWVLLHSAEDRADVGWLEEGYGWFSADAFARARAVAQGVAPVPALDARDAFHLAVTLPRVAQTGTAPVGILPPIG